MVRDSVQDILDRALDYSELPIDAVGGPTKLLRLYNTHAAGFHNLLCSANENYATKVKAWSLTEGQALYLLPSDFYKSRKVWLIDGDRHYPCKPFVVDQIDGHNLNNISAVDVELWYTPQFHKALTPSEEIPLIMIDGWEDFVAWSMAAVLLGKRGDDNKFAVAERDRLRGTIVNQAEPRDDEPKVVVDVSGRWDYKRQIAQMRHAGLVHYYMIEGNYIRFLEVS